MDGGVSGSGTHADIVSGAGKALILALGAMTQMPVATMTIQPASLAEEVAALAANGTPALLRGPEPTDVSKLMSPAAVPEAIAMAVGRPPNRWRVARILARVTDDRPARGQQCRLPSATRRHMPAFHYVDMLPLGETPPPTAC
jgi:hypothetical protein